MDKIDEKIEEVTEQSTHRSGMVEVFQFKLALKEMALYATKLERERIRTEVWHLKDKLVMKWDKDKLKSLAYDDVLYGILLTKDTE